MPEHLFDMPDLSARDERLIAAYARTGRTLDDLPYTREFDALMADVGPDFEGRAADTFRRLHTLRKAGRLPRSERRGASPAAVTPEEESLLIDLVIAQVGTLGQRDQLPYTAGFDKVHAAFNTRRARDLTPHDVWRLIARLAK
jgi:hypothetical protein